MNMMRMKPKFLIVAADSLVMIAIFLGTLFTVKLIRGHLDGAGRLFAYSGLVLFALVVFPLIHKTVRRLFKDKV
jgi:heme O synthase-like polyprenyltransferase